MRWWGGEEDVALQTTAQTVGKKTRIRTNAENHREACVCVLGGWVGSIIRAAQQWRSILEVKWSPLTLGPCKSGWHCDRNTIIKGILVSCNKLL